MRKSFITLVLMFLCAVCLQAQNLNGNWYNGSLCYTVTEQAGGKVLMNAMAEGEEHEFVLVPVEGQPGCYVVNKTPNDYVMQYEEGTFVKHQNKDGYNVFCFYDKNNRMVGVMEKTQEWDTQKLNVAKYINQIMGEYTLEKSGTKVDIQWEQMSIGGVTVPYKVVTFNGIALDVIEIEKNNTELKGGTYQIMPFLKGLNICPVAFPDGGFWFKRIGDEKGIDLIFSSSRIGRFSFASSILLDPYTLRQYNRQLLRYMRNEILARHGYRFQSKELNDYFTNQSWYKPVENNGDIQLTFLEELNVATIKFAESEKGQD